MANTRFDWDTDKDAESQRKHGVSFNRAQYAFADPQRVIAKDITHSQSEERFYCFGEVDGGCLRCDSHIAPLLFESSAQAIGAKER
ncbi:BrnT family toxin [Rugosibacter aromaticivorans]|uniref:BrnT family toxin n=1 Tax=Rugosibacter aromaticivorans TaxID=1565605 RepID=UPI000B56FF0F|nr:D158 [uncultured bacterium]